MDSSIIILLTGVLLVTIIVTTYFITKAKCNSSSPLLDVNPNGCGSDVCTELENCGYACIPKSDIVWKKFPGANWGGKNIIQEGKVHGLMPGILPACKANCIKNKDCKGIEAGTNWCRLVSVASAPYSVKNTSGYIPMIPNNN